MAARLVALLLWLACSSACMAYEAASSRGVDLSGQWVLNAAASDDAEAALMKQLEKEAKRVARQMREEAMMRPPGAPPDVGAPRAAPLWQKRRLENFRKMLQITQQLQIRQQGSLFDIESDVESRRLTAGSRSQVSMPEGELADSQVGWDGQWFVISRDVRRGPRLRERFRLLKSGQLEYELRLGGDSELAGVKLRRIFDRASAPRPALDASGPQR